MEVWTWRRMEKFSWTDRVRSEILKKDKKKRNILHPIKKEDQVDWSQIT